MQMRSEKIKNIKRRYKNEWLLIKVDKLDPKTTTPITGRLISHSPNREKIYQNAISYKGFALVDYSEDKLPKGYAIAFQSRYGQIPA